MSPRRPAEYKHVSGERLLFVQHVLHLRTQAVETAAQGPSLLLQSIPWFQPEAGSLAQTLEDRNAPEMNQRRSRR